MSWIGSAEIIPVFHPVTGHAPHLPGHHGHHGHAHWALQGHQVRNYGWAQQPHRAHSFSHCPTALRKLIIMSQHLNRLLQTISAVFSHQLKVPNEANWKLNPGLRSWGMGMGRGLRSWGMGMGRGLRSWGMGRGLRSSTWMVSVIYFYQLYCMKGCISW